MTVFCIWMNRKIANSFFISNLIFNINSFIYVLTSIYNIRNIRKETLLRSRRKASIAELYIVAVHSPSFQYALHEIIQIKLLSFVGMLHMKMDNNILFRYFNATNSCFYVEGKIAYCTLYGLLLCWNSSQINSMQHGAYCAKTFSQFISLLNVIRKFFAYQIYNLFGTQR